MSRSEATFSGYPPGRSVGVFNDSPQIAFAVILDGFFKQISSDALVTVIRRDIPANRGD